MAVGGAVSQGELDNQKALVRSILGEFDVSKSKTRVGLIHYGEDALVVQSLKDSYDLVSTLPLVEKIQHNDQGSNLLKTLQTADLLFKSGNGERSNAKKILILFVDSLADSYILEWKSTVASLSRKNVRIIVVGFAGYVQPSAVKLLLGSGRNPILVGRGSKLDDKAIMNLIIGQLREGIITGV